MNFFRYPGGKSKLKKYILSHIKPGYSYMEPFVGAGSIFLEVCDSYELVWINDKDPGIYCIWYSCLYKKDTEQLIEKILSFKPSKEAFYEFKEELINLDFDFTNTIDIAFKKIAIHQLSFSGLGTKSGGPLGGKKQESKYKIDCRWNPDNICKKIKIINEKLKNRKTVVSNQTFADCLISSDNYFIYLDPPYFEKGNDLYQQFFSLDDHVYLSEILKNKQNWLLSYDDCDTIRDLYNWANIKEIEVNYTIKTARKKKELLICSL